MPDIYLRQGYANPNDPLLRNPLTPDPPAPTGSVRRYYHGPMVHVNGVRMGGRYYYVDEAA